jgi:hypothetical protein
VYLRLGSALLGVAAGAAAIVLAVLLLQSQPGPVSGGVTTTVAGTTTTAEPSVEGGRIPTPTSPGFPSPPNGAVVFAREADAYGLGLAIVPGGSTSLVRVSVLSTEGGGQGGLSVSLVAGGTTAALPACATGCYQANIATAKLTGTVTVKLGSAAYPFVLPASLDLPSGTADVVRAGHVWRALKTLVWHERLAASPTEVLHTVYKAVAPHSLNYTIDTGAEAIIIGQTRWDRASATSKWIRSVQDPPVTQPVPYWVGVSDARVIGTTAGVLDVTFFDPGTPAWFEARIDEATGRTLTLRMIATAHFMQHVYGPFDAPIHLRPPTA